MSLRLRQGKRPDTLTWKGVHAVVTGGAGFIGSHLLDSLLFRGATVAMFDDLSRGTLARFIETRDRISFYRNDVTRKFYLEERDVVFHLAAKVAGIEYNRTHQLEMFTRNMEINRAVLRTIEQRRPKLSVLASTACVYSHDAPVPTPESAGVACNPEPSNWGYGLAKWYMEAYARMLHDEYGLAICLPRFFNVVGKRDHYDDDSSHVVAALLKRILSGENPLLVWGSGSQTRTFTDARDISKALILLAECPEAHDAQPVNVGNPREISIRELAGIIAHETKQAVEIAFDTSKPDGHARRAPDVTRLRQLVGWVPDTPLETTLQGMIGECRAYLHAAKRGESSQ